MFSADGSNYTGTVQVPKMREMVANGLMRWISGLQYPPSGGSASGQIAAAIAAGVPEIHVYAESTPIAEAWPKVSMYRDVIARAWLAVEPGSGFETLEAIREGFVELDALALPKRAGIYTSTWALQQLGLYDQMAEFAARDLWWAGYNGAQDLEMRPLAAWQSCVMHQFYGGGASPDPIFGVSQIDLSYYEEADVQTTPITESEEINVLMSEISAATTNNALKIASVNGQPKTYVITLP